MLIIVHLYLSDALCILDLLVNLLLGPGDGDFLLYLLWLGEGDGLLESYKNINISILYTTKL